MITKKMQPRIIPQEVGKKSRFPKFSDCSIDGKISDQTEAAIISPEAKPKNRLFALSLILFLKRKTTAEPRVVIKNIKDMPIMVIAILLIGIPFSALPLITI